MKNLLFIFLVSLPTMVYAGFGSKATTNIEKINRIDIQLIAGEAYYYFTPEDGNWSSGNCPNATTAFLKSTTVGSDAILSAALAAKMSGVPVQFRGVCGNGVVGGSSDIYLYVDYLTLSPI